MGGSNSGVEVAVIQKGKGLSWNTTSREISNFFCNHVIKFEIFGSYWIANENTWGRSSTKLCLKLRNGGSISQTPKNFQFILFGWFAI